MRARSFRLPAKRTWDHILVIVSAKHTLQPGTSTSSAPRKRSLWIFAFLAPIIAALTMAAIAIYAGHHFTHSVINSARTDPGSTGFLG